MRRSTSFFLFLILGFAGPLFSNDKPSTDLKVLAVRATQNVELDGKLSEPTWKDDYAISTFVQRDPVEGAAPSEKTLVDVLYDDDAIYIGARMYDADPSKIEARLGRKDVELTSDSFYVYIDPFHDKRTGYYFGVNAAGTQYDGTLMNDSWNDNSWDGVWEGKASIDEKGWTAEIRIPYSQLRFQKSDQYVWGINFKRNISRKNEVVYLVYTPKNANGFVSRFPDLVGIENIQPKSSIEVIPYFTSRGEFLNHEIGDPFNDGFGYDAGVGGDARIGLGTNLTLNATVNPDFGQVEVDPAVVNLSDVETFYPEKRPFFVEGSNNFTFGQGGASNYWGFNWWGPDIFYSRRIGRAPQGEIDEYDYQDFPDGTRILGAMKLTGKMIGDWNLGTLHALTGKETAQFSNAGTIAEREVEPLSYYSVSRMQKEFNNGRQGLGFINTITARSFDDQALQEEINDNALVFGLDGWTFLGADKTWVITGYTAASRVAGTAERITAVQESSRHYFQRPDQDYLSVDENATSLSGSIGRVLVNKEKGNVIFNSAIGFISPGLDVNDLGFMFRADQINGHVGGGYKWTKPGKYFRYAELIGAVFRSYDFDLNDTWNGVWNLAYLEFPNYYSLELRWAANPEETINNYRTRGGPATLNLPGFETGVSLKSDSRKQWVFGANFNSYEADTERFRSVGGSLEWKPVANISISAAPQYEYALNPAQYIDTFEDASATHTYGNRYVFGELDQKTFSAGLRLNWTFSPTLSLQLYGQPLVSAGKYTDFKELAASRTFSFNHYSETG
ncbi:MAG TPA: DUF5916 domain-containing protein, partial [Acidobacteriota bacterium]|nr:DUF5916 domain-containing protein [Acidobacteriota bacterium]